MKRTCHLQKEAESKRIKSNSVMKQVTYLQNCITKWLHDKVVSLVNTYIHTYINPKPNKETAQ